MNIFFIRIYYQSQGCVFCYVALGPVNEDNQLVSYAQN